MKDFYIRDAGQYENQTITTSFVVASKQIKPKRTGDLYLALTLADRTGQLEAKVWDNVNDYISAFEQDDFIKVKGLLNRFNNKFQFTVHKLRRMEESEVDFSDYLPKTEKDVDELWRTVANFVAEFRDPNLKALITAFMSDPQIASAYKNAPAAKTLHHAFIGGLLDHVVSLFRLCDLVSRNYPQINRDLLMSGAFLHDIGKVHELSYSRSIGYTTEGQLLGHMIIELEMLHGKTAQVPGFPDELKILLEHMIISHHGHYEFGSPKLPMFPEALMLHYLDDLDSKMESMRAQFERDLSDEPWAGYNNALARPLLNSAKFLNKKTAPVESQKAVEPEHGPETEKAAAAASGTDTTT